MMSGLEVAMAHVAGPGNTREVEEDSENKAHNDDKTQGRIDWRLHYTQR